jgi:hypothetical protein
MEASMSIDPYLPNGWPKTVPGEADTSTPTMTGVEDLNTIAVPDGPKPLIPKPILLLGLPQTTNDPMKHVEAIGKELSDYHVLAWRSPTRKPVIEVFNCPANETTVEELRARIEELCKPTANVKDIRKAMLRVEAKDTEATK